jgi:hypothetical protein
VSFEPRRIQYVRIALSRKTLELPATGASPVAGGVGG